MAITEERLRQTFSEGGAQEIYQEEFRDFRRKVTKKACKEQRFWKINAIRPKIKCRQECRERSYYHLHRNLNYPLLRGAIRRNNCCN